MFNGEVVLIMTMPVGETVVLNVILFSMSPSLFGDESLNEPMLIYSRPDT